jgi:uncharacterized protein
MKPDLTDAELDELASLLAATPEPFVPMDVPMLDGYLCGVLVQPRIVPIDEWLPPVWDAQGRGLPADVDAAWLARVRALVERRRDALAAGIAEDGSFDPVTIDIDALPPASEYDAVQSPVSRALQPWVDGFEAAQAFFPDLENEADEAIDAALWRLYRHLPPQDDEQRERVAALDRAAPLADLPAAIDDLVAAVVHLWDLTARRRLSVATVRRDAAKVGRNDPCPCGSGKKFKACHGR